MSGPLVHKASFEWAESELKRRNIDLGGSDIIDWYHAMLPDLEKDHAWFDTVNSSGNLFDKVGGLITAQLPPKGEFACRINHWVVDCFFHIYQTIGGKDAEVIFEPIAEFTINKIPKNKNIQHDISNYLEWRNSIIYLMNMFYDKYGSLVRVSAWKLPLMALKNKFRESIRCVIKMGCIYTVSLVEEIYE